MPEEKGINLSLRKLRFLALSKVFLPQVSHFTFLSLSDLTCHLLPLLRQYPQLPSSVTFRWAKRQPEISAMCCLCHIPCWGRASIHLSPSTSTGPNRHPSIPPASPQSQFLDLKMKGFHIFKHMASYSPKAEVDLS